MGKPDNEDEYEEEYAINCIEELKQFTERSIEEESTKLNPVDQSHNERINKIGKQSH